MGVKLGVCFAICCFSAFVAEGEGFEPPNPLRSTVFKTAAINHSANPPSLKGTANLYKFYRLSKFFYFSIVFSSCEKNFHWKSSR